jgi:hypothetical protein
MIYRVKLTSGETYDLPGGVWDDLGMALGNTYDAENTQWWNDIIDGLQDHLPDGDIESVEVLPEANDRGDIERLRRLLLATPDIWQAIGVLSNELGAEVGGRLETLLCREITKGGQS